MLKEKTVLVNGFCNRLGRDPTTLRRSVLLWPSGGADPWAHHSSLAEIVERFSPLGFSDFIAFPPPPEHSDVYDHLTSEVLPALRDQHVTVPLT